MDPTLRAAFNRAYTPEWYRGYLDEMARRLGEPVPFRVAETPVFLPRALRDRLASHAREIVSQLHDPALTARLESIVPAKYTSPCRDHGSHCIQVDFAIVRDAQGELDGRLVELQGFPSLYAFTVVQTDVLRERLATMPGLDQPFTSLFPPFDRESYVAFMREAIVGRCDPRNVVLLDLDPPSQKTRCDFVATKQLIDVDAVCPTELVREGRYLYRTDATGKKQRVERIYHRVVFDELDRVKKALPFAYTDDLDVTWVPHPDWYWIWSKYTVPYLSHPSIPAARFLSDVTVVPDDLGKYVLKPLFSFAGTGVKVDVTRADLDAIPVEQRHEWLLQEKIDYATAVHDPQGNGIKTEIRMMFLRRDQDAEPQLVLQLVRLSRGKMHGVDHNRDLDWVGGTVGLWAP